MGEHTFDESGEAAGSVMARVIDDDETLTGVRLARLGAIADLDRTRDFQYDGYPSATAFLIHRCGMGAGEAKREVFLARSMRHMPYAVKSAYAGHISITQLELLAYARSRHPDLFEADESTLVASVSGLTTAETRRVVDYWCQAHDHHRTWTTTRSRPGPICRRRWTDVGGWTVTCPRRPVTPSTPPWTS